MHLAQQDGKDTNKEEYEHLSLGMFSSAAIAKGHSMNTANEVHHWVEFQHTQTQTDIILGTSEVKYLSLSQNM